MEPMTSLIIHAENHSENNSIQKQGMIRGRRFYIKKQDPDPFSMLFGAMFGDDIVNPHLDAYLEVFPYERYHHDAEIADSTYDFRDSLKTAPGGVTFFGELSLNGKILPGDFVGFDTAHSDTSGMSLESCIKALIAMAYEIEEKEDKNDY